MKSRGSTGRPAPRMLRQPNQCPQDHPRLPGRFQESHPSTSHAALRVVPQLCERSGMEQGPGGRAPRGKGASRQFISSTGRCASPLSLSHSTSSQNSFLPAPEPRMPFKLKFAPLNLSPHPGEHTNPPTLIPASPSLPIDGRTIWFTIQTETFKGERNAINDYTWTENLRGASQDTSIIGSLYGS